MRWVLSSSHVFALSVVVYMLGVIEHYRCRTVAVLQVLTENRNLENSCNHQLLYILPFRGPHLFVQMRTKTSTGIRSSNFQQNDLNGVEQHRARLALLWGRHGTISKTANGVATGIDKRVCVCWEGERLGWQLWVVEQVGHSKGFFFFINIVR